MTECSSGVIRGGGRPGDLPKERHLIATLESQEAWLLEGWSKAQPRARGSQGACDRFEKALRHEFLVLSIIICFHSKLARQQRSVSPFLFLLITNLSHGVCAYVHMCLHYLLARICATLVFIHIQPRCWCLLPISFMGQCVHHAAVVDAGFRGLMAGLHRQRIILP